MWVEEFRSRSQRRSASIRKDTTAVKEPYPIVNREEKGAGAALEQFARSNGQLLLPLIELTMQARIAVKEVKAPSERDHRDYSDVERLAWGCLGWRAAWERKPERG